MQESGGDAGSTALGPTVTPDQVLKSLMNDGHFDDLRVKILNQLKQNEEIRKYTSMLVEQSKVLNTPGAESKNRRELFEALRRELEGPVLERASKAAWELILSKEGVGKEITEKVDAVYTRLSENDMSAASSHYPPTSNFQDRATGDLSSARHPLHARSSGNGHRGHRTDRGSTPGNDLSLSTRKPGREQMDYYHPPVYD
ncbi:unnamed protein product [Sphagnum troendelagicum]|uniref:Uncharacterized protein n=1 Tax=Sphagnum troendelagicum TaxID=128251 RepID=A0ABP0ULK7_9BRYO